MIIAESCLACVALNFYANDVCLKSSKRRFTCQHNVMTIDAYMQGRRTRSGRSGPGPDQLFSHFFFLSFEANGFARGLKLNEIEHYKLDESKGRSPRETFFVSSFSPAFPHARRRHPSLRYNFSRHLLSIFHVSYILSTYKTHSGPQHIHAHATLRPRCHPYILNCWHKNARTLDILWKVIWFFVDLHRNMSVFAKLSRTLGYLPFPSLRSSFIRTDLLSFQTGTRSRRGLANPALWFSRLWRGQRTTARTSLTAYINWWRKTTGVVPIRYFFLSNYSYWKVTISALTANAKPLEASPCHMEMYSCRSMVTLPASRDVGEILARCTVKK